jgi:opacity protein-like surface antigen
MAIRFENDINGPISRTIFIKLGLASVLLFTTTHHANAEEQKPVAKPAATGFYTSVGISVGIEGSVPINDPSNSAFSNESFQTDPTIAPNAAIGYSFPGAWRAELEYVGFFADSTNKFTLGGIDYSVGGGKVDTNAAQINIIKDIPTNSKITPYIGGGVGFASSRYSVPEGSQTGTTFAGQAKVGISYTANPNTDIYFGYRLLSIAGGTSLDFWSDKPTTKTRIQHSLDLGVRYRF